jgi:hypothetical protein
MVLAREARSASWLGLLLLSCVSLPVDVHGAQVLTTSVTLLGGRYFLHSEVLVRAPVSAVRTLLTDYEKLPRLNPNLKRVAILKRLQDGGVRMRMTSDLCILALCLSFHWIQEVRTLPGGDIVMTIFPGWGDFREGGGRWRLLADDGGTRLTFDVDLVPNFWIPSVLGPWLMKRKLAEETYETATGLERIAVQE